MAEDPSQKTFSWTGSRTLDFLLRLEKYHDENGGKIPSRDSEWNQWAEEMKVCYGDDSLTGQKLKNKRTALRKKWQAWSQLLKHTGLAYDPSTGSVPCNEEFWKRYIEVYLVL